MKNNLSKRESLKIWHEVTTHIVKEKIIDLSNRQLFIILEIYLFDGPHTIKSLSASMNTSKAVVVRAVDTLSQINFLKRRPDPRDRRSVLIVRTAQGSIYVNSLGDLISQKMNLKDDEKGQL